MTSRERAEALVTCGLLPYEHAAALAIGEARVPLPLPPAVAMELAERWRRAIAHEIDAAVADAAVSARIRALTTEDGT